MVRVISKKAEDTKSKPWIWESKADAQSFTITEDKEDTIASGTRVILHLKEDSKEFLDAEKLEELIKKYSQFFSHPIYLSKQVTVPKAEKKEEDDNKEEDSSDKEGGDDKSNDENKDRESEDKKEEEEEKEKTEQKDVLMNPNKPIWLRDPKDVKEEEYKEFYKAYFNDYQDPITHVHFKGEGDVTFRALFFIPKRPPYSPFSAKTDQEDQNKSVSLYVRRVFTKKEQLFSEAMSPFLMGIIDSDELPLNVSRETLQNSALVEQIRRKSVNKVLDHLAHLSESNADLFDQFYAAFSPNLKLEIVQSEKYRKRLAKLLKYETSKTKDGKKKSLTEIVESLEKDLKEGDKKKLYFLAGREVDDLRKSPLIEKFLEDGVEVLFTTESLDEYCLQALRSFEEYDFVNVAKEESTYGVKDKNKPDDADFKPLLEWLKKTLEEEVSAVNLSSRLKGSSCAVVASEHGISGNMEQVLKAQAGASSDPMLKWMTMQKKIFEINPAHEVIQKLRQVHASGSLDQAKDICRTIYNGALIRSGYAVKDSKSFMTSIDKLVLDALGNMKADASVDAAADEAKTLDTEKNKKAKKEEKEEEETSHDDL